MRFRQALIAALLGVNLLLLAGVILVAAPPPAAMAQFPATAPAGTGFVLLACQAEIGNDVIYLLDTRNRFLHAFRTPFPHMTGDPIRIQFITTRDLSLEFRREARR